MDKAFGVRPALQLDLSKVVFSTESKTFTPIHNVTVTPGSNMTKTDTSGAESQKVVYNEEMTDVVYTADTGYY